MVEATRVLVQCLGKLTHTGIFELTEEKGVAENKGRSIYKNKHTGKLLFFFDPEPDAMGRTQTKWNIGNDNAKSGGGIAANVMRGEQATYPWEAGVWSHFKLETHEWVADPDIVVVKLAETTVTKTVVFQPGSLGLRSGETNGLVVALKPGGQADTQGVKAGMRFLTVGGVGYSYDAFQNAMAGEKDYEATFEQYHEETAAPFLHTYFLMLKRRFAGRDLIAVGMSALTGDKDELDKMKEENREWFEKEGKPVLTNSFINHDTNKNGVLGSDEAKEFFSHLVGEQQVLCNAMAALTLEQSVRTQMALLAGAFPWPEDPKERKKQLTELESQIMKAVQDGIEAAKKDTACRVERYNNSKEERNAEAFKVMDVNEDGTIQLEEFLNAFDPDHEKMQDLLLALGFVTEQEKLQEKQMKKIMESRASNSDGVVQVQCNQQ